MSNGKKYRPKSAIKLELGAYVLSTEIRNGRDYLVLRNVPNGWRVEWRDDSHVYSLLLSVLLERGEGLEEYLSHWFAMIFMASTIFPDVPMVAGYFKFFRRLVMVTWSSMMPRSASMSTRSCCMVSR